MTVSMTPISAIGTDPTMAMNAKNRMAKSGILEGARVPALSRTPIPADLPSVGLTLKVAVGSILAPPSLSQIREQLSAHEDRVLEELKTDQDDNEKESREGVRGKIQRLADLRESADQLAQQHQEKTLKLEYKSRPLDGIWATAPYLHNGSVPNLAELLKPEQRSGRRSSTSARATSTRRTSASPRCRRRARPSSTRRSRATATPATVPTARAAAANRTSSPTRSAGRWWST